MRSVLPDRVFNEDVQLVVRQEDELRLISFNSDGESDQADQRHEPGSRIINARSSPLDIIANYLKEAKHVFYRDRQLYQEYLCQLRYYAMYLLDQPLRQDFWTALVRQQALRQA